MSLYVLDTDTLELFQGQHPAVITHIASVPAWNLCTSVISVEEQLSGWYDQLRKAKDAERLAWAYRRLSLNVRFLSRMQIVDFDEAAIARYEQLKAQKLNVRKMDLRIAAIVIELPAVLVSRNLRDFSRVSGLVVEDWSV